MTSEQLLAEGRALERPCVFLRPQGPGTVAAVWYERDSQEIESTGHRCWLTVDSRYIPGSPSSVAGYISVFTDESTCQGGRIAVTPEWPARAGKKLYAHPAKVLPPIDAVFALGSDLVGAWLRLHGWERGCRCNSNFKDGAVVDAYEEIWYREFPICFESDIHAVLGGWHFPCSDDDWHDLLEERLMVLTIRGSEPWV
jgi:hypothetical protein